MQKLMDEFTVNVLRNTKTSVVCLYNVFCKEHPEVDQYMPQFIQLGDAVRYAPQILKDEILKRSLKRLEQKG